MKQDGMYVAVIVTESSSDARDYQPLYEESIMLVRAASVEEARRRAGELGRDAGTSYTNEMGETITWTLKHVVDVVELDDELGDGATVYARHFRDYAAYRRFESLVSDSDPP